MKFKDLTGLHLGRLTAIEPVAGPHHRFFWKCICECGNSVTVLGSDLTKGHTTSCGCWKRDATAARALTHGETRSGKRTTEYGTWCAMKRRCNQFTDKSFKNYGGRGIKVCKRWDNFINFLHDMGRRPSPKYTLERKNNDGNYSKSNCVWADRFVQANNNRHNRRIVVNGVSLTVAQWSRKLKVKSGAIYQRLHRGQPVKELLCEV